MTTPPVNALQLVDNQEVTLSVEAEDSMGQPVSDTFTWTVDVAATIAITPSGNTCLCVAGAPGTATVTVVDGSTPPLSATETFTVVAGQASQLVITPGAITTQP
jgi:hypothetical protein